MAERSLNASRSPPPAQSPPFRSPADTPAWLDDSALGQSASRGFSPSDSPSKGPNRPSVVFPKLDVGRGESPTPARSLRSDSTNSKINSRSGSVFCGGSRKSSVLLPDLAAKPVVSEEFDGKFRERLKSISVRNNDTSLQNVYEEREKILSSHYDQLMKKGEENERRHKEAEEIHQRMLREKKYLENQQRTKNWIEVLIATISARKLYHELLVHHAFVKLRDNFRPMLSRKVQVLKKRRERRAFTQANIEDNPRPTAATLLSMKGDFFKDWSVRELDDLIQHMQPRSYRDKEYIMFDGDFDREMYVLVKGSVRIMIRDKSKKEKSRNEATAKAIFPLQAPAYFGEFALLCMEPRSASIQCVEDCHVWVVSQQSFARELEFLSPQVAAQLQAATDKRRKENLQKFFPLRLEVLRKQPFLAHWNTNMLQELISQLDPHVERPGTVLFREGDYQPVMYIVGEGTVRLQKEADPSVSHDFVAGDCIGVFETFFTHERRPLTGTCQTHVDIWSISRQRLVSIAMEDPDAMLQSRRIVQEMKAATLTKSPKPAPFFANDPYIQWCFTPHVQQLVWAEAEPRVYCTNDVLFREGEDVKGMYIIALGSFSVSFSTKGFEDCNDELCVNPALQGIHSSLHTTNDNVSRLFPSVTTCDAPNYEREMPTSPTLVRLVSDVSAFIFSANQNPHTGTSPTHATTTTNNMIGIVFNSFEIASRRSRCNATVKCLSQCDVWFIRKEAIDGALSPKLADAIEEPKSISHIIECYNKQDPSLLYNDHSYKPVTHYQSRGEVRGKDRKRGARSPIPSLSVDNSSYVTGSIAGGSVRGSRRGKSPTPAKKTLPTLPSDHKDPSSIKPSKIPF